MKKIQCSILTPERTLFDGVADFVVVQAYNGEMGFLVDHSPLISELGIGEIRLKEAKSAEYIYVEGGVVEIRDNRLIVLAETAVKKDEINRAEVESRLKELESRKAGSNLAERIIIQTEGYKLKARLKVSTR